jgi:hypothetical protein
VRRWPHDFSFDSVAGQQIGIQVAHYVYATRHDPSVVAPIAVHRIPMTSRSDALSPLNLSREG